MAACMAFQSSILVVRAGKEPAQASPPGATQRNFLRPIQGAHP